MIKSTAYLLAFGVSMTPVPTTEDAAATQLAGGGCCMHREDSGPWRVKHREFQRCLEENRDDGDNVMDRQGSVWWNSAC